MERENKTVNWRMWLAGTLALLLGIVALQNSQQVDVDVLMINLTAPLIVIILVTAALGAVLGYVAPLVRRHRHAERDSAQR